MSKLRIALLKDCSVVAVAWIDKSGVGQAIKINIPGRKQKIIRQALAEGIDFPEPKAAPEKVDHGPLTETPSGILHKKPSLIIPASALEETPS